MKVDVEDISPVKKVLHVEIPEEDVSRELDKAYSTLKSNVQIKGFRPGKVPRSILERRFKKDIHEEVSGQVIQNSYGEALGQAELAVLGEPTIDRPELEKGQPYRYSATVEVRPFIEDLDVKGLKLKETVYTVTDEEVDTQLKMLQKHNAQLRTVDEDRPVANGDVVIIDYEGFKDGKPLEAARKTENFQVEVGSGRILHDFDQQIVGMQPNNKKEFQVRFPDDYYNQELAGLEVSFQVTLKEIKEEILPELDDEFAKDLGEYHTLDKLRDAIRKDLEGKYEAQSKRQLREDILDKLIEQSDFDLPPSLLEAELSDMVKSVQNQMAYRGTSLEDTGQDEAELSKQYRPMAERKVREYLLMEKVIEQEGITLTDEFLEEAYKEFANALNQPVDRIKEFHKNDSEAYEFFKQKTLEKLAIKEITENSHIEKIEAYKEEGEETQPKSLRAEPRSPLQSGS